MGCIPSKCYGKQELAPIPETRSFLRQTFNRTRHIPSQPPLRPSTDTSYRAEKLRRLQTPGVVVIVDASNLEIEGQKLAWELTHGRSGIDDTWRIHYEHLLRLIAKKGDLSQSPTRNIVAAHCISSEGQLIRNRYTPGRKTWNRLGITFTIPSSRNFVAPRSREHRGGTPCSPQVLPGDKGFTRMEKAVDHTLVRIMTQEFEGLQLLHPNREDRPHRTIALVAGDFDYVDVVEQARLSGCDIEMWYWTGRASLSTQWIREESRRHEALGTFTFFDLRQHFRFLTAEDDADVAELPGDRPDRVSIDSGSFTVHGQIKLGGATGHRRFVSPMNERRQDQRGPPTPEMRRVLARESSLTPRTAIETASPLAGSMSPQSLTSLMRSPKRVARNPVDDPSIQRCSFREFCSQEGCEQRHTEAERQHFGLHGGKGRYRVAKTKACKGGKLHIANEKRMGTCPFLHEAEATLCLKCLQTHDEEQCVVERIRPINALEARTLVKNGYLVDLLMAKSTVVQPSSSRSGSRTSGISDGSSNIEHGRGPSENKEINAIPTLSTTTTTTKG